MSSVWVDVSSKDITDNIDYAELENLFAADAHETKKPNIGMALCIMCCKLLLFISKLL